MSIGKKTGALIMALALVVALAAGCAQKQAEGGLRCTVEVRCDLLTDAAQVTNADILELIPEDGELLAATEVAFSEGETVLEMFKRAAADLKLQMEFDASPIYGTYIRGIGNIYSGDAGETSGWMYKVNGEVAVVSCDNYALKDGDAVCWFFSPDMNAEM